MSTKKLQILGTSLGNNVYTQPEEPTDAPDGSLWVDTDAEAQSNSVSIDASLTIEGQAADAKATGDAIRSLSEEIANIPNGGSGLTTEQANALDGMFKVCAFTKADISAEYNAFCTAFGIEAATITGISATYSGGDVAVGTAVTDLTGIVVTANYSDGSKRTVTGYTLSGTIAEGSNTITVTYEGMTTTFTVTGVAEEVTLSSISATYSGGDVAVGTAVTDLTGIVVTAHYSDGTSKTVTGYTLSGTIADGSNTVTVTYQGKTTTFMVTGTAESGDGDGTEWTDGVPYEYSLVENEYVDRNSGGFVAYSGWSRTPYLPCKGASKITAVYVDSGGAKLTGSYGAWYTAEKTWINNFNQSAIITSIPENACFVVFSQADANMQNIASITPTA